MSEPYTYEDALTVAEIAVLLNRSDVPCPSGAIKTLLARIAELELRSTVPTMFPSPDSRVWVDAWMHAREYYGTTDDETDQLHGAECARVQGPYVCTCTKESQQNYAFESYRWYQRQG